jgi:hypothetical protein
MLALSAVFVACLSVSAEEPVYVLKFRKPEKGDVAIVLDKHDFSSRIKLASMQPKAEPKDVKLEVPIPAPPGFQPAPSPAGEVKPGPRPNVSRGGGVFLFEETILDADAKQQPTRLQRRYEQALSKKDGQQTTLSLEWKTLLIEKKDDKFRYALEGKDLTGEELRTLEEEFAKGPSPWDANELLLPKDRVRINDSWTIATEPFVKDMEDNKMKVDAAKSTAKGKLLRVYDKDGRRFGVIEARLEFPLKNLGEDKDNAVPMVVDITLDTCIDGTSSDFLRTETTRIMEAVATQGDERPKPAAASESNRQWYRKEVRKK